MFTMPSIIVYLVGLSPVLLLIRACPEECSCSQFVVQCIDRNLKEIPNNIPKTVKKLDLSNNPHISIKSDYFLQFPKLSYLILSNCSLKGPIYLPRRLIYLKLDSNLFTFDSLSRMFSENEANLKHFSMASNKIDIKKVLPILPKQLKTLYLDYNQIDHLTEKDLIEFVHLKKLKMAFCQLNSIQAHTFDKMTEITDVSLNNNQLTDLPDGLFKHNNRFQKLDIFSNKLRSFSAAKLGIRYLLDLEIQDNEVETVDVRLCKIFKLNLSNNRIKILNDSMFADNPYLTTVNLGDNRIDHISSTTFKGLKTVFSIFLHNCSLHSLPGHLFDDMGVTNLFLQENQFANLTDVFHGMKKSPDVLLLSSNKNLQYFQPRDFESFESTSTIYLTCKNLKGFSTFPKLKASVKCSPSVDFVLHVSSRKGLACNGYECSWIEERRIVECRSCRRGQYDNCKHCADCPAGSFYQDDLASRSCKNCPLGQFVPPERSPGKDAADCQTCPEGTNINNAAGYRACQCMKGYAREYRFGACAKCTEKGFECSRDYKMLRDEYWYTWAGTRSGENKEMKVADNDLKDRKEYLAVPTCENVYKAFVSNLETKSDSYDRSSMHFNCQMPLPIKCPMHASCLGGIDSRCSSGYTGALCAVCSSGYVRSFDRCLKCGDPVMVALEIFGYIALFALVCLIVFLTEKVSYDENGANACKRTLADIFLSSLKILIGFYQIVITIFQAVSDIHWPNDLRRASRILEFIQFQVFRFPSLRCINPEWRIDSINEFWFTLIVTVSIPVLVAIYFVIKSIYIHAQQLNDSMASRKKRICGINCTKVIALFLFITFPLTSSKIVQVLPVNCASFCTAQHRTTCIHTVSYLRSDFSIDCHEMIKNRTTLIVAYCSLTVTLGLPIVLWILLKFYVASNRCQRQEDLITVNGNESDDQYLMPIHGYDDNYALLNDPALADIPVLASALKFAYENYEARCWYWEVIEMVRKLIMTNSAVLFLHRSKTGLASIIIASMFFIVMHAKFKPMKSTFENGAQLLSLFGVTLTLSIGAVLKSEETEQSNIIDKKRSSQALGIVLVVINSLVFVVIIARLFLVAWKKILKKITERSQ